MNEELARQFGLGLLAAARADGPGLLSVPGTADSLAGTRADLAAFGRCLVPVLLAADRESFASALAAAAADPEDVTLRAALFDAVRGVLTDEPARLRVTDVAMAWQRRAAEAGDTGAMLSLADLLADTGDVAGARAECQRAAEAGDARGLLAAARLAGEPEAEAALLRRAVLAGDPGVAAEGAYLLGRCLFRSDPVAARDAFARAEGSGHPLWAPAGTTGRALLLAQAGDTDGSRALCAQVIASGDPDWAAKTQIRLGALLDRLGDPAGAVAAYQAVIDARTPVWDRDAMTELTWMLRRRDDLDGLRAAYAHGLETGNPAARSVLYDISAVLHARGDYAGAQAALHEALAHGEGRIVNLRWELCPAGRVPEPPVILAAARTPGVPAELTWDQHQATGAAVLARGRVPALPDGPPSLRYGMMVPIAWCTEGDRGQVMFTFWRSCFTSLTWHVQQAWYVRDGDRWVASGESTTARIAGHLQNWPGDAHPHGDAITFGWGSSVGHVKAIRPVDPMSW